MRSARSVWILGVRVDDVTIEEAGQLLLGFLRSGEPHMVTTPNPEIVMAVRRDPEFRQILNSSDLAIPDGIGLVWASRLQGRPLRQHVTGTDLVLHLARVSATEGSRWFLLGAGVGVAEQAGKWLAAQFSGLRIVGAMPGSPWPEDDADTVRAIGDGGPVDVLLVAYGAPLQEKWLARNNSTLGVPVTMGVGGVFNYLAGRNARAPRWMRRAGLEWLHRLATEPWRWRRQLALPAFAILALAEAARLRVKGL